MFAVYAAEPNPDAPLDALVVGERPDPEVPDGSVAVHVEAASLNMHDLWTLRGVGIKREQFPMILGCDGAGRLDDGTEVVIYPVIGDPAGRRRRDPRPEAQPAHRAAAGHVRRRRAWSRPATSCRAPAGLTAAQSAVMGTAWLTAYRMLFVKSGLRPGQTMLVQGASGGVSTALIQLGRAAGMQVWVTGRTEEKRALAEQAGRARHVRRGRAAAGARGRGVRDRRRRDLVALDARAEAGRRDRRLRARRAARTPARTCSDCSSSSCGSSARRWAPAPSSRTC